MQFQHYIPWRAVWKTNSLSTPCRVVFDTSSQTTSGYSLNDILAKGRNNLNKLQITLRWKIHKFGFTTDIRKMYNTIKLDSGHWCYQQYLWQKELDLNKEPEENIELRPSGNQAESGLQEIASLSAESYPVACNIIHYDMYVDECISGAESKNVMLQRTQEFELVVNKGGIKLKGVTSGISPTEAMIDDGETVFVGGMKWFPKEDSISLNVPEINFSKKLYGKRSSTFNYVPEKLSRRHCISKIGEIFDLHGTMTP